MNKQQYLAQPTPAVNDESWLIIEAVKAAGFVIKDDHDPKRERTIQLSGVCVYQDGARQEVIALMDKSYSSYYCLNSINLALDGTPYLTRDNCAGMVKEATGDPKADVESIIEGIRWDRVEKFPVLAPGQYFNFVLK